MPSIYDTLHYWARKTTTSIGELCFLDSQLDDDMENASEEGLIYRLKYWPDLRPRDRTADVFRALSVMSQRPVNRHWIIANSKKMHAQQVDQLLQRLIDEGAIEVIDGSKYMPGGPPKAAATPVKAFFPIR
jgi:hypothetical protein